VGKTFTIGTVVFALCILFPGIKVLWTAHHSTTTDETFDSLAALARRRLIAPYIRQVTGGNGKQSIRFTNGSRIMFGAREHGFGRGIPGISIIVFDEAQILTSRALDDMIPATSVAANPLIIYMGTPPKPSDPSEVFTSRRAQLLEVAAQRAAGADVECDALYVEVSADPGADPDDREQWGKGNPSYPHRTTDEAIQRLRAQLADDDSFLREGLGIWDPTSTPRVIDEVSWNRQADPASMAIERLTIAIDVPPSRKTASVSLSGQRADGNWHVELDEERGGVDWAIPWVVARTAKNPMHAVVVDELSGLVEKRRGKHYLIGTDVVVTLAGAEGRDMAIGCAKYYDGIVDGTVFHTDQPQVNVALSVARKRPVAGAWAWNRKDPTSNISPVVSETLALWGAQNDNVQRPTRRQGTRTAVIL
jgi:hypothetical protein